MTTSNLRIRKPIGLTQGAKILSQLNRLANSALLNLSAVEIQARRVTSVRAVVRELQNFFDTVRVTVIFGD